MVNKTIPKVPLSYQKTHNYKFLNIKSNEVRSFIDVCVTLDTIPPCFIMYSVHNNKSVIYCILWF